MMAQDVFIKHQDVMAKMTALITQMSKAAKISPEIPLKLVKTESNPSGAIGNVMVKKTALMALMSKIAKIAKDILGSVKKAPSVLDTTLDVMERINALTIQMRQIAQNAQEVKHGKHGNAKMHPNASEIHYFVMAKANVKTAQMRKIAPFAKKSGKTGSAKMN